MTTATSIPAWSPAGVIPPIRPAMPGHSFDRSPYPVELITLIDRFATSPERVAILNGLLAFRSALHKAGVVSGFQWLDGSFLEQIEILENRPPRDMDVVTFLEIPAGYNQLTLAQQHSNLFDQAHLKTHYSMDAYFAVLGQPTNEMQVKNITYWYSMWSHRRDGLWKGFIQVDLHPSQDAQAQTLLTTYGGVTHA